MTSYSILVNTCDRFDDCWHPYFKLHAKFWPDCTARIYLNTETKDFTYPGLNVEALKVSEADKTRRHTWSECLLRALDKIEDDIVLYMQEDYFLKARVQNDWVEHYVRLMHANPSVHCIHLTDQGSPGEVSSQCHSTLVKVPHIHKNRISCQAALWRKDVIRQYVRQYESAWYFEWFGSKRAGVLKHNFFTVDRSIVSLDNFEIIPYLFTGVIGGRWNKGVVPLFADNDLIMDYSKRGFFVSTKKTFAMRVRAKFKRLPLDFRCYLDLLFLKIRAGW